MLNQYLLDEYMNDKSDDTNGVLVYTRVLAEIYRSGLSLLRELIHSMMKV